MLELRPTCENCKAPLPPNSTEAMICSFECTFCSACVENVLQNVCPNCGGGFEKRPVRPKTELVKYPSTDKETHKPLDTQQFEALLKANSSIDPENR